MSEKANRKLWKYSFTLTAVLLIGAVMIWSPVVFAAKKLPDTQKAAAAIVDINNASATELESIKGVGPAIAKKIVANRPYKTVSELSKAGLSAKAIDAMKPFITVGKTQAAVAATQVAAPVSTAAKDVTKTAKETKKAAKSASETAATQVTAPVSTAAKDVTKAAKDTQKAAKSASTAAAAKLAPGTKININTADQATLEKLPEIGPVKAQAIIKGRPYKAPEDIMKVAGIKEKTFAAIKDYIVVR